MLRPHPSRGQAFAEAVAPYGPAATPAPYTKLSISLPAELVELVRGAAAERGESVSAMIGAAIRRTLDEHITVMNHAVDYEAIIAARRAQRGSP